MAKIPEYRGSGQIIGPVNQQKATGEDFGASQGRALQGLGNEIQKFGNELNVRAEQREISRLNAEMAQAQAELTIELQKELNEADPNDDTFGERYQAKVQERMAKIGDTAETRGGKLFFEKAGAETSAHFFQGASLGQIQLAGQAAKENYLASIDSLTTMVAGNPSSYQFAIEQSEAAAMSMPNLSTEDQIKVVRESAQRIAESAMLGEVQNNPYAALESFQDPNNKYRENTDGAMMAAMINRAEAGIEAREVDVRRAEAQAEKAAKDANDATALTYVTGFLTGEKTVEQLTNDPAITDFQTKENLVAFAKRQLEDPPKAVKSGPAFMSAWSRIRKNELNDPNDVLAMVDAAEITDRITPEDSQILIGFMNGKKDPLLWKAQNDMMDALTKQAFMDIARPNTVTGMTDVNGQGNYNNWLRPFLAKYAELQQRGLDPMTQILNKDDPNFILNFVPIPKPTLDQITDGMIEEMDRITADPDASAEDKKAAEEAKRAAATTAPQVAADGSDFDITSTFAPASFPGVGGKGAEAISEEEKARLIADTTVARRKPGESWDQYYKRTQGGKLTQAQVDNLTPAERDQMGVQ